MISSFIQKMVQAAMGGSARGGRPSNAVLALFVLPVVLAAGVSVSMAWRTATASALSRRRAVASLAAVTLKERMDRLMDLGRALATRVRFQQLVASKKWEEAVAILASVPGDFPAVERVWLADVDGVLRADTPAAPGVRGQSFVDKDWYKGVAAGWQPYLSEVYMRPAEPRWNLAAAAIPIVNGGVPVGVLGLQVKLDTLLAWSREIELKGDGERLLVTDHKGRGASGVGQNPQGDVPDMAGLEPVRRALRGERGVLIHRDAEDGGRVAAYAPIDGYGWTVVVDQSAALTFRRRNHVAGGLVVFFLVTAILTAGLMTLLVLSGRRLREQGDLLHAILDSAGEGIVVADLDGKFTLWNPTATKLVGLGAADVSSQEWSRHYGAFLPDGKTPFPPEKLALARALRGESTDGEEELLRNPGRPEGALLNVTGRPLRDREGRLMGGVVVFRDITERRRGEEEIKRLNQNLKAQAAALLAANKELESFSYSVSHDLRAPLRSIDGFSQAVLEDEGGKLSVEGRASLERVRAATQRMGQLIDDMLALSRVTRRELEVEALDVSALAGEVVEELRRSTRGHEVDCTIQSGFSARGDKTLVRVVLENLLGNAWKFTSKTGAPRVEVGARMDGDGPVFFVRDNGAGFDMTYASKLFGVFQRLHAAAEFPGTGIGLATVQRIVQRHGGRAWAEGEVGKGAVFYFTLRPSAEK